jgi:hypothetical protein
MKKSLVLVSLILGLTFSAFSFDSPLGRERKRNKKAKTEGCCVEMSKKECMKSCSKEEQKDCMKK